MKIAGLKKKLIHMILKPYIPVKDVICMISRMSEKLYAIKFHGKPVKIFPLKNSITPNKSENKNRLLTGFFIPIRKKGKLPGKIYKHKYKLEYGIDEIEVHKNAANKKDKILIIDDLIATGGTAIAAANLMRKFNPQEIQFHFIINLYNLNGMKKLQTKFKSSSFLNCLGWLETIIYSSIEKTQHYF